MLAELKTGKWYCAECNTTFTPSVPDDIACPSCGQRPRVPDEIPDPPTHNSESNRVTTTKSRSAPDPADERSTSVVARRPFVLATIAGFVLTLLGFSLPWGPSGPTNIRWGVKITNSADKHCYFAGVMLVPGETIEAGPAGTVKITSPEGRSRIMAKTYDGRQAIWGLGYASFFLGLCGAAVAGIVLRWPKRIRLIRIALLALSGLGLGVNVCRVIRLLSNGYSLPELFCYFAPFGRLHCSSGFFLASIGFVVAFAASALLVGREPRDNQTQG